MADTDPLITFWKANDIDQIDDSESTEDFLPVPDDDIGVALKPEDFGSGKAGESTTEHEIHIYNNKGGTSDLTTAYDLALTFVTLRKENSGGELVEGKEIIEMRMGAVKDVSGGSEVFIPVGGMITIALGDLRGDKLATPNLPVGTVGHGSGGQVLPDTYYAKVSALDETGETMPSPESVAVQLTALSEQTVQDANSETLSSGVNSKISYAIQGIGTYVNGFQLLQTSGGTLEGTLRLETDNAGEASGTLVSVNSEKTNIVLQDGEASSIFFNNEITWEDGEDYHLVFVITNGTGTLKGKSTGSTYKVKYYDGTWHNSSNIYDLYCNILGDNLIDWEWDEVENAETYKVFRTQTSESYDETSMIAEGIETNTYEDKLCNTITGTPLLAETVTYEHKKIVKIKFNINSTAQSANAEFYLETRHNKA